MARSVPARPSGCPTARTSCGPRMRPSQAPVMMKDVELDEVLATMARVVHDTAALATALDPDAIRDPNVVALWKDADQGARSLLAVRTLLTRRVEETRAWQREGFGSAAEHVAQ